MTTNEENQKTQLGDQSGGGGAVVLEGRGQNALALVVTSQPKNKGNQR